MNGTPCGDLSNPTVSAELTADGRQVTVSWSFPENGGNGREVGERKVSISGAATTDLDPSLTGWTSDVLGLSKTITVTVRYCVSTGPDPCRDATAKATTTSSLALPTLSVGTLAGICGATEQNGGDWPVDQIACGSGIWVPVTGSVTIKCQARGADYFSVPLISTPTDNRWYRSTDNDWYRAAALLSTDLQIPNC